MNTDTDEHCLYGSFTQRLVSALVDENIMAPMTGNDLQDIVKINSNVVKEQKVNVKKSSTRSMEIAIKDELFALGLIDSVADEENELDADDEILSELRKCQSELKALRSHNKHTINKLITRAKAETKKQEVRQKARVLDSEVVDIFRRFSALKMKKKGFSRKDRELAWKTIRERESIWKMVENENDNQQDFAF